MLAKTINRSALLSWSPNFDKNSLLACGTAHFSDESNAKLEFFNLSQEDPSELLSISVPSRFNRILWTSVEANYKNILVGSFSNGKIEVYDVEMLLNAESNGIIEVPKLHSGSVNGLCSSFFQPNLIATGATNGEIALWDLDNIKKSSLLSVKKSESFGKTSDLAWNPRVAHILAAASDSGVVSVIDLRSKKEVTNIKLPNFASVSSIAWNPDTPTSIVASSNDDANPFAYLWDLRASEVPKNIFKGHSKGISSLSWCRADSKLMLSAGHDGKTLCWNPESNQISREYSEVDSLDVKFCPSDPNIFCVSHRDFIEFHSINDEVVIQQNDCDNIGNVAPKWMHCPVGSSFGGNNICSTFRSSNRSINLMRPKIDYFASQVEDLINYENVITQGLFNDICDKNIEKLSNKDEITIWRLLKSIASTNTFLEVLNLAESCCESCTDFSNNEPIENCTRSIGSLDLSNLKDFETSVIDKIVESDFEGAMNDCFAAGRPVDALLISNCGGIDLRSKAENFILKSNNSFHLNLAVNLSRNDLHDFTSTAPVSEWFRVLRVISKHSDEEYAHHLFKQLAARLIGENMNIPALFAAALAVDFELFLEVVLKLTLKNRTQSVQELIDFFKIIRIIEALKPNSIKCIEKFSTKIAVFEIVSKLTYMLSSAGFKADFVANLLDKDFYDSHVKTKNPLIDTFVEFMETSNSNTNEIFTRNSALVTVPFSESKIKTLPQQTSSSSSFGFAQTKPQFFSNNLSCSSSPSQNRNYNDVPMLIPKFSKHSPQLCSQDIKLEDAALALKSLSNAIGSKALPTSSSRVVEECFKKLSPELICSKNYSDLSKSCIATLLKELSSGNFDLSATLAANILASFFNETKDWILPLKRLTEIAKN